METWTRGFESASREADEVVIGGGPLMELDALDQMLFAFIEARKRGAVARIEGCGIGPVSSPLHSEVIAALLRLSSHSTLRDAAAKDWAGSHAPQVAVTVTEDPAVGFIRAVRDERLAPREAVKPAIGPDDPRAAITCFLRDWPHGYRAGLTADEFEKECAGFERGLVEMLHNLATGHDAPLHLLPMHCLSDGGDDRVNARRIARLLDERGGTVTRTPWLPVSPWQIVDSMRRAKLCVCMRFHSVVFAETLGVPYIAVDYTGGGKIASFLRERGREDRMITPHELADGGWKERIKETLKATVT